MNKADKKELSSAIHLIRLAAESIQEQSERVRACRCRTRKI